MSKPILVGTLLVSSLWSGSAFAETVFVDLISPATCTQGSGRLTRCAIQPQQLEGNPFKSVVPMRTVIQRNMSGNCSTQFPLEVSLTPVGEPTTRYVYISNPEVVIRGLDRKLLTLIDLKDSSPWTSTAAFADTCRISLNILWNQVDVDSTAQASAILQGLQDVLDAKVAHRDALAHLVEYSSAFNFMRALSLNLLTELNNDMMLFLREQAKATGDIIFKATLPCECNPATQDCSGALTDSEKIALANLYFSLGVLGDNSNYLRPDGTRMTLEEYLGSQPGGSAIRGLIEKLALRTTSEVLEQYKAQLAAASEAVKVAQDDLNLGKQQLAPWLTTP